MKHQILTIIVRMNSIAIIVFFFLFDEQKVSDVKVKFIYLSFIIFKEIRIDKLYCIITVLMC